MIVDDLIRYLEKAGYSVLKDFSVFGHFEIYTNEHVYKICYQFDRENDRDYLGCVLKERNSCRGADLPDGPLTEKTWKEIVTRIEQIEGIPLDEIMLMDIRETD